MTTIDLASVESRTRFMQISPKMGCSPDQVFKMKPLPHNTMSPSIILKGAIDRITPLSHVVASAVPTVAKVSSIAGASIDKEVGLEYESKIYNETNRLVKAYVTPHVLVAYGAMRCPGILDVYFQRLQKVILDNGIVDEFEEWRSGFTDDLDNRSKDPPSRESWVQDIKSYFPKDGVDDLAWAEFGVRSGYFETREDRLPPPPPPGPPPPPEKLALERYMRAWHRERTFWRAKRVVRKYPNTALITYFEQASGKTLDDALMTLNRTEFLQVLQQLVYTVVCFTDIGLVHNDLHHNNVFVDKLAKPTTFVYFIDNNKFIILPGVEWFARIFDYDYGTMPSRYGINPHVAPSGSLCENIGVCSYFNPKFDLYTLMGTLYRYRSRFPKDIKKIIKGLFKIASPKNIDPSWMPFLARFCHRDGVPPEGSKAWRLEHPDLASELDRKYQEEWRAEQLKFFETRLIRYRQRVADAEDALRRGVSPVRNKAELLDASDGVKRFQAEIADLSMQIPPYRPDVDDPRKCRPGYIPTDEEVLHPLDFLIKIASAEGTLHELSSVAPDVLAIVKEAVSARRVFTRKTVDRTRLIRTVMSM